MDEYECELCQRTNEGFGNNGQPVVDGRVCDVCNATHVLPARLMAMKPRTKAKYVVCVKHETWWTRTFEATDKDEAFRLAQRDWWDNEEPQLEEMGWQFDDGTFEVTDIDEKDDA